MVPMKKKEIYVIYVQDRRQDRHKTIRIRVNQNSPDLPHSPAVNVGGNTTPVRGTGQSPHCQSVYSSSVTVNINNRIERQGKVIY